MAQQGLDRYQQDLDNLPSYEERVETAKKSFPRKNRKTNPIFRVVRATLTTMCYGPRRCGYCEDSVGDEVEHIKPKDLYPELCFVWENYLYACGNCNGPKSNSFAVIDAATGSIREVQRPRRRRGGLPVPVVPPHPGSPALIDPRHEDPRVFMDLDLLGTFIFMERGEPGSEVFERARYTIELLHLNDRDFLIRARHAAYSAYLGQLSRYVTRKEAGASQAELEEIRDQLLSQPHPTVWEEMKHQQRIVPELRDLFQRVPDALDWQPTASR